MRSISDETANNEMFIAVNGPKIGEVDETLKKAFNLKFGIGKLHFYTQNLFRSSWINVEKHLKKKSKFEIYDK